MSDVKVAKNSFLSHYASSIFWLSRYLERVENLTSLLDVTYSFSAASKNAQNWQSMLALHCDEEDFATRYNVVTAENVIRFYFTDEKNSNSIISALSSARINASKLRPVISTEMWRQISNLHREVTELVKTIIAPQDLWHILANVRRQCQMLAGSSEAGLYRDQGWYFYMIGKNIERADQTTRLIDIKYHLLLPTDQVVGSTIDSAQWFSVLRAAGGYHAFRREYPYVISPATVAGFLLLDRRFPRSVATSIDTLSYAFYKLNRNFGLTKIKEITELNEKLAEQLREDNIQSIIARGLHEYLDNIQLHLIKVSDHISENFF